MAATTPRPAAAKVCKGPCRQEKLLEDFHRNRSKPDGRQTQCKDCFNAYLRQRYEWIREDKEPLRVRQKRLNQDRKQALEQQKIERKLAKQAMREAAARAVIARRVARANARVEKQLATKRSRVAKRLVEVAAEAKALGVPRCDCATKLRAEPGVRRSAEGLPIEYLKKVYASARNELMKHEISEADAVVVIQLIARGKVPGVAFEY